MVHADLVEPELKFSPNIIRLDVSSPYLATWVGFGLTGLRSAGLIYLIYLFMICQGSSTGPKM